MTTIFKSPVGFFSADTSKSIKQVPKGKLWIHTVQFTTYELEGESMDNIEFTIAAALPSVLSEQGDNVNARLFARQLRQLAEHYEGNKENLR